MDIVWEILAAYGLAFLINWALILLSPHKYDWSYPKLMNASIVPAIFVWFVLHYFAKVI